jgi:dolichol-phosphate mannosyltransferase
MPHNPQISLVMPMHNEQAAIRSLLREIFTVFDTTVKQPYEIIIVDDASNDGSVAAVEQEQEAYFTSEKQGYLSKINVLKQPARSGQFKALIRGMAEAKGDCIITMDSDLQYNPEDIPRLLPLMGAFDMVCGVRAARHDGAARRICSAIANSFRNLITGDTTTDSGCMFRVMRAACVAAILPSNGRLFGCEGLFFPLLARRKGFRIAETSVEHRPRGSGKSRYHLVRGRLLGGIAACLKIRFGGPA